MAFFAIFALWAFDAVKASQSQVTNVTSGDIIDRFNSASAGKDGNETL